jgi:CheY-like chemotaxis protein
MVYGMAQRHRAEIEIDSKPHAGTTVRLVFPAASSGADAPLRVTSEISQAPLHVLVVDDDPLLIETMQSVLQADRHLVTVADSGQSGIDAFTEAHRAGRPFAVVFTDLGMPYVDGRKVAAAIKAISPDTPVVALTGWGSQGLSDNERQRFDRILSKPPRLADLRAALAELVRSHDFNRA